MLGEDGGDLYSLHRWGLSREEEHKGRKYFNKLQEVKNPFFYNFYSSSYHIRKRRVKLVLQL